MSGIPGRAIISEAEAHKLEMKPVEDYSLIPGQGITGVIEGKKIFAGNRKHGFLWYRY